MRRRVAARREEARALLSQLGCATAEAVARRLGITHSQAAYALKMLESERGVVRYKVGRVAVWCASSAPLDKIYTAISPCFRYAEEALRELLEGARGSILTLAPGDFVKAMARRHRRKCIYPLLLAAARSWLESRLDGAILTWSRNGWRDVKYVIDVKKAREKLAAAGYV